MTEAELQQAVIECAHVFGWRVAHFRPALTKHGWRTPVAADGKGFPDLLMVRGPVILAVELKVGRNKPSAEQMDWLRAFAQTSALAFTWREQDWLDGTVERVLRGPVEAVA